MIEWEKDPCMGFKLLDLLLPRESSFFTHMSDQAANFLCACEKFHTFLSTIGQMDEMAIHQNVSEMKNFELRGDEIERHIIEELETTFITPMDREDIHSIVVNLDQCTDSLNTISQRIEIYGIRTVPENMVRFCVLIVDIAKELNRLIQNLKGKKDIPMILKRMHMVENEADTLFHATIAGLFKTQDPIELIKFKELYEQLEQAVDRVDYIGKVVRGIIVKQG
jgi:uncharacterized protein